MLQKLKLCYLTDEQEALNSIMQDLAELHRSSRPAMFPSDLGKPKASSPKNQVTRLIICEVNTVPVEVREMLVTKTFAQIILRSCSLKINYL